MIELDIVPFPVRGAVKDARRFTREHWEHVSKDWELPLKGFAAIFRRMGEVKRATVLKTKPEELDELTLGARRDGEEGVTIVIALFCLSDEQLDLLISTFTPFERKLIEVE
jgi:hypothetical protein